MKPIGLDQAFNFIVVYKMECNQKKLNKKPIQSASNVDIDNLVELYFISGEKKILMKKWICWNLPIFMKNYQSQNMSWQLFHLWMIWSRQLISPCFLMKKLITIFQFHRKLTLVSKLLKTLSLALFWISTKCIVGGKLSHELKAWA